MKETRKESRLFRLGVYFGATLLVVAVAQLQTHLSGTYRNPWVESLTPLQEKQLEAFLEMNRLLTTLGTALLGGMGFLLVHWRKTRALRELWPALAGAACVGFSVYFGYLVYLGILWMLQGNFFDLNNPHILWARQAHFYTFLLGVVFFADFAFRHLSEGDEHERLQDLSGD